VEIPLPSPGTIEAVWAWSKKNIEIWSLILSDPGLFLSSIDLGSNASTINAIQFSFLPITLSIIIELPIYILTKDTTLGFSGYLVSKFVAYYAIVIIFTFSQRVSSKLFTRRRNNMNACFIATLYASAFWPISVLPSYLAIPLTDYFNQLDASWKKQLPPPTPSGQEALLLIVNSVIEIFIVAYLITKFIPMAKITNKVGAVRASLITFCTILIGLPLMLLFMMPLNHLFFGYDIF
jgi:hypothetical protein